jgi:formylglycine-generating enzyme required for sulfatase activity
MTGQRWKGATCRKPRALAVLVTMLVALVSDPARPGTDAAASPPSPDMVAVAGCTFTCGDQPLAAPTHEVRLTHDFSIGRYEVTNLEYRDAVQWAYDRGYVLADTLVARDRESGDLLLELAGPYGELCFSDGTFGIRRARPPWIIQDQPKYEPSRHPVHDVTWFGAAAYCNWISEQSGLEPLYDPTRGWRCRGDDPYRSACYRLPTEAEWELAARGPESLPFPWGEAAVNFSAPASETCNHDWAWTTPVGQFSPLGDSPCGAADMIGNVWEWVYDRKGPYTSAALVDPIGPPQGHERTIRGGAYNNGPLFQFCAATRSYGPETGAQPFLGFRPARTTGAR